MDNITILEWVLVVLTAPLWGTGVFGFVVILWGLVAVPWLGVASVLGHKKSRRRLDNIMRSED